MGLAEWITQEGADKLTIDEDRIQTESCMFSAVQ
jgi:hypothetical protein